MTAIAITCDRVGAFVRAAVWRSRTLCDLFVDRVENPDLSGAVVRAKAVRVSAGGKAAWFDAGLAERLYFESPQPVRSGEMKILRIQTTLGEGKAWPATFEDGFESAGDKGVLSPPPLPWQRALATLKDGEKAVLRFAAAADLSLALRLGLEAEKDSAPHPELDDVIDGLLDPVVSLPGGANIVIAPTPALVAIDVNGGESANAAAVNLLAVREAARQVRLRGLGGIIVIDALKMQNRADTSKVLNALSRVLAEDPGGAQVFGMTKLGLIEMIRARRGPALGEIMGKI